MDKHERIVVFGSFFLVVFIAIFAAIKDISKKSAELNTSHPIQVEAPASTNPTDTCKQVKIGDKWTIQLEDPNNPFLKETKEKSSMTYTVLNIKKGWVLLQSSNGSKYSQELHHLEESAIWKKEGCK